MAAKRVTPSKDGEQIVPLHLITDKRFENARSGKWAEATSENQETGEGQNFADLKTSLEIKGQDQAIFLRPIPKGAKNVDKDVKYEVVAGFRRFRAISELTKEDKWPFGGIKAHIKEMSDTEARALNIRENTARDNLSGPDLAWAVWNLNQSLVADGTNVTDTLLAQMIGKSQGYVQKLMTIMRGLCGTSPKLAEKWRNDSVAVSVSDMKKVSEKKTKEAQEEAYNKALLKTTEKGGRGGGRGAWDKTAMKTGASLASLIGWLEYTGYIELKSLEFNGDLVKQLAEGGFVKLGENCKAGHLKSIADAMQAGYDKAWTEEESGEGEESAA